MYNSDYYQESDKEQKNNISSAALTMGVILTLITIFLIGIRITSIFIS